MSIFDWGVALAQAADTAAQVAPKQPAWYEMFMVPAGFILIFYFLLWRPQQKKAKDQELMLNGLKPGDEIVTTGGIIGKIRSVADGFVTLEVANNTNIKVLKSAVSQLTKQPQKDGAKTTAREAVAKQ